MKRIRCLLQTSWENIIENIINSLLLYTGHLQSSLPEATDLVGKYQQTNTPSGSYADLDSYKVQVWDSLVGENVAILPRIPAPGVYIIKAVTATAQWPGRVVVVE